jgi:hypothetical protein
MIKVLEVPNGFTRNWVIKSCPGVPCVCLRQKEQFVLHLPEDLPPGDWELIRMNGILYLAHPEHPVIRVPDKKE